PLAAEGGACGDGQAGLVPQARQRLYRLRKAGVQMAGVGGTGARRRLRGLAHGRRVAQSATVARRCGLLASGELTRPPEPGGSCLGVLPTVAQDAAPRHHRVILLGSKAQEVLAPWLSGRGPESYCFSPQETMRVLRERQECSARPGRREWGERYRTSSYSQAV